MSGKNLRIFLLLLKYPIELVSVKRESFVSGCLTLEPSPSRVKKVPSLKGDVKIDEAAWHK